MFVAVPNLGIEPCHVNTHLMNALAKQAANYPPSLVNAVFKALKTQTTQYGETGHLSMKLGAGFNNPPFFF